MWWSSSHAADYAANAAGLAALGALHSNAELGLVVFKCVAHQPLPTTLAVAIEQPGERPMSSTDESWSANVRDCSKQGLHGPA